MNRDGLPGIPIATITSAVVFITDNHVEGLTCEERDRVIAKYAARSKPQAD